MLQVILSELNRLHPQAGKKIHSTEIKPIKKLHQMTILLLTDAFWVVVISFGTLVTELASVLKLARAL